MNTLTRNATQVLTRPRMDESTLQSRTHEIPSIHLISATDPSLSMSSESWASISPPFPDYAEGWAGPAALAPRNSDSPSKRRLVPKKSKLSLLGGSAREGSRKKERDFSDVVRRVGGDSSTRGGFEIYVDPSADSELGEVLMVHKKKSRAGLRGLGWGKALDDVTNATQAPSKEGATTLKVKDEPVKENKWWTIGRGRKDSKDKEQSKTKSRSKSPAPTIALSQNNTRSRTPEPFLNTTSEPREGSLNAGSVRGLHAPPNTVAHVQIIPMPDDDESRLGHQPQSRSTTPTFGGLLAPPSDGETNQGSIAVRAIRSVRSLARMGSWAQLKNSDETAAAPQDNISTKEKSKAQDKSSIRKAKKSSKKSKAPVRSSTSSFEAGALTASPEAAKTLGTKKRSVLGLGLGLPSTMRLPNVRHGSSASSLAIPDSNRLSADSAQYMNRNRSGSVLSTGSSLRPMSVASSTTNASSGSSARSIRWDENGLETVRETREQERKTKRQSEDEKATVAQPRENRHSSEGRRRTPVADVFPAEGASAPESPASSIAASSISASSVAAYPILTVEAATADGHSCNEDDDDIPLNTPAKRSRQRPISEQLLGRTRPKPFHEDSEDGVLSMLSAATNDLAQLINNLDLEATPATPDMTPLRASPIRRAQQEESPLKKTLRKDVSSITSLRPYAQSRGRQLQGTMIGQQIASWQVLESLSVANQGPPVLPAGTPVSQKRLPAQDFTPSPAKDASPVLLALRPARSRQALVPLNIVKKRSAMFEKAASDTPLHSADTVRNFPVFSRIEPKSSVGSVESYAESDNCARVGIARETRRMLGMQGTMGASDVSLYQDDDVDSSDPDSDIPNELQELLKGRVSREFDDTMSYRPAPPSPGSPPMTAQPKGFGSVQDMPVFRAQVIDDDENYADLEETTSSGLTEEDTKKSFDFTGELMKLNESGGSDRRSFVEQLENAFRTPAKIDLLGGLLTTEIPPVPSLPSHLDSSVDMTVAVEGLSSKFMSTVAVTDDSMLGASDLSVNLDITQSDDMDYTDSNFEIITNAKVQSVTLSRPSPGQLNKEFKFGGKPSSSTSPNSSLNMEEEEDSVMNSILEKATEIPARIMHERADSSVEETRTEDNSAGSSSVRNSTHSSVLSFDGMDSFEEVRRGFEFPDNRAPYYPPPAANARRGYHGRQESAMSFASVSSYGHLVNPGIPDPFDFGLPSLQERPSVENLTTSMSMSVSMDDTFSFLPNHAAAPRRRVDSDASSFYFQPVGHRRHESVASVASVSQGPPISLYNRSFGHRRNASSVSGSSIAHSYAMYGAAGGRAAWASHRPNYSIDSSASDISAVQMGRPGLGDKMFDNAGATLPAISASPSDSFRDSRYDDESAYDRTSYGRSTYDSIMDNDGQRSDVEDSLFDKTGQRVSVSSESMFGHGYSRPRGQVFQHLRPSSELSVNDTTGIQSLRSDDTMISMLGGGHVRRQSMDSAIGGSPVVQMRGVERKKRTRPAPILLEASPKRQRILAQPSIASSTSSKFGDERMIRAKRGLLERMSLEESALMAQGEDASFSLPVHQVPVFSRPAPASRPRSSTRSSTYTTSSSGRDTPPLSASDGSSSMSEGSQSSIDFSEIEMIMANSSFPVGRADDRARSRARGQGHRRRITEARASRSSVYETIEEENSPNVPSKRSSPTVQQPIFVVDSDTISFSEDTIPIWDDERGIVALRRYYELREEAEDTVKESRQVWIDTPMSVDALQAFSPPKNPDGMQALLQHSVQTYGPLPTELFPRRIRSRTQSRPSPYPTPNRGVKISVSPEQSKTSRSGLREVFRDHNVIPIPPIPSPAKVDLTELGMRPRVGSAARRSALGWAKRKGAKTSTAPSDLKENEVNTSQGSIAKTPNESLRIKRPRPKGRPTPARPTPARTALRAL